MQSINPYTGEGGEREEYGQRTHASLLGVLTCAYSKEPKAVSNWSRKYNGKNYVNISFLPFFRVHDITAQAAARLCKLCTCMRRCRT